MPGPLRYQDPKLQDLLAANYVIGTLRGQARKRFEKLMQQDSNIAQRVRQWESKLQTVHAVTPSVAPQRNTWQKITQAINNTSNQMMETLLSKLRFYKFVSAFAVTFALVLSVYSYTTISNVDPDAKINYVAVMQNEAGQPTMVATLKQTGRLLALDLLQNPKIEPDKDIQLWTISKEDGSFKSLGLINIDKRVEIALTKPEWGLIKDAEFLVVSIESKGGSTTGLPSDKIITKGLCVKVEGWEAKTS
jgi:anti-sigma-K factor RskA